jgi:ribosomal protein L19E
MKTHEQFIKDATKIFGINKYDYIEEYKGAVTRIKIKCLTCQQIFKQKPNDHLSGHGCSYCGRTQKLSTDIFIQRAKLISNHQNKNYDYGKTIYVNAKTKVEIICPTHGSFWQNPISHLNGNGCFICSGKKKVTTKEFVEKANKIFGNRYDYIEEYKGALTKINIKCLLCQTIFKQKPNDHLNGHGCRKCYNNALRKRKSDTLETFIEKANTVHGEFTYNKVKYLTSKKAILITCPIHGDFSQLPATHLQGSKCPKCSNITNGINKRKTTNDFILKAQKIFGNLYDYTNTKYITARDYVTIKCNIHNGIFQQIARDHLSGYGCPLCCNSKGEQLIENFLKDNKITFSRQYKFTDCKYKKSLSFDFAMINNNILYGLIEYQGIQHYKSIAHFGGDKNFLVRKIRDKIKQEYCIKNNIPLLVIPYTSFNTIETEIKNFLNKNKGLKC